MIVGVALVVDELHKGQRLVFRYPENIPSAALNSEDGEMLLAFHKEYLSLSPENFAKLFRPKNALSNKVLELFVDDLHYICFPCSCVDDQPLMMVPAESNLSGTGEGSDSSSVRITFFNLVLAKVRDAAMNKVKGRRLPSEIPKGTDPVALALGLQTGQYYQSLAPEALRQAVELVSRALLREERRTRYVSRQVSLILAIASGTLGHGGTEGGGVVGNNSQADDDDRSATPVHSSVSLSQLTNAFDFVGPDALSRASSGDALSTGLTPSPTPPSSSSSLSTAGASTNTLAPALTAEGSLVLLSSSSANSDLPNQSPSPGPEQPALSQPQQQGVLERSDGSGPHTLNTQLVSTSASAPATSDTVADTEPSTAAAAAAAAAKLSEEILQRSSLANELRCMYHSLVVGHMLSLSVNGAVDVSVQLNLLGDVWLGGFAGVDGVETEAGARVGARPGACKAGYGGGSFDESDATPGIVVGVEVEGPWGLQSSPSSIAPLHGQGGSSKGLSLSKGRNHSRSRSRSCSFSWSRERERSGSLHSYSSDGGADDRDRDGVEVRTDDAGSSECHTPLAGPDFFGFGFAPGRGLNYNRPLYPQPQHAILLIAEPEELAAILQDVDPSTTPPPSPLVLSLLPHLASPTASLEDVARELELPRGEVCSAARALCSWGLAFLQPLLTAESVLQVTKNAPFGLLTPVARAFAAAFLGGFATAEHSSPKLLSPLPGPSSVSVAKASIDPYPPLSAGSQGSWGRGYGQRRLTLGVRGAVADKDVRVSAVMSEQVLESIPPVSLPVILSVFDGHRPLSEALELIPRSLSTQGLDIVIWLLRRRMVIILE